MIINLLILINLPYYIYNISWKSYDFIIYVELSSFKGGGAHKVVSLGKPEEVYSLKISHWLGNSARLGHIAERRSHISLLSFYSTTEGSLPSPRLALIGLLALSIPPWCTVVRYDTMFALAFWRLWSIDEGSPPWCTLWYLLTLRDRCLFHAWTLDF